MTELFGPRAAQLAGLAAQTLGWRPAEFWNATPPDLALALKELAPAKGGLSRRELDSLLESERDG
ncbi:phage tail assembly chaperone [Pontixanthobacter aquaemixtae]|uniref:Phage tail assembly chaperone n=1 Tax=Pontixanthobacter aquaemixtae TaxID=1958940 RepID=A0A844ZW95_9SPHN|nr:phage tail assembly chaperone [Pontixanthobacter aquaemixtae]MXO91226.1 phage tail assembly chaperone [Pontixanthobacter aquaemixtae]